MSRNKYLDNLIKELAEQGVVPVMQRENDTIRDKEIEVIENIERVTGKKFSDEQRKILLHHGNARILACAGSGKALVDGTGVLTPYGYVGIETLRVGDIVFDHMGKIQEVLGVYPQGKKRVHKVYFSDGNIIKCCSEHLWTVTNDRGYYVTRKTSDIMEEIKRTAKPIKLVPNFNGEDAMFYHGLIPDYKELIRSMLPSFKELLEAFKDEEMYEFVVHEMANPCKYRKPDVIDLLHYIEYLGPFKSLKVAEAVALYSEFQGVGVSVEQVGERYRVKRCPGRSIIKVEETDVYRDMTCIQVSGTSQLFLTEHCIPTHNTTVSVNLIAKRILTGEIRDVNRLIYTTYSKAGATEMKERLDSLLKQLGMGHIKVQVRTLHSFFLYVLRIFGVSANIISATDRTKFIKKACRDAEFVTKDDELMLIDNLLSYQINNLLDDKKTIASYVNTLENLTLEQYSKIRVSYAKQKQEAKVIDYDDMQSYLYLWLVKFAKSSNPDEVAVAESVRNYCKAMWTDFYIDEAQDVCKIQFAILRAMVSDPNDSSKLDRNLVFIGDDSQCLIEGTEILTDNGYKSIEQIKAGDKVISAYGNGETAVSIVDKVLDRDYKGKLIEIETESGKRITVTDKHIGFICGELKEGNKENNVNITTSMLSGDDKHCIIYDHDTGDKHKVELKDYEFLLKSLIDRKKLTSNKQVVYKEYASLVKDKDYTFDTFDRIEVYKGCEMPVLDKEEIKSDKVTVVREKEYIGKVYDLSIPKLRNFIANGVVVHNCIYEWRGSDPSIILTISATFDIPTFVLSTNYRCLSEIVEYASAGIKYNVGGFDKDMKAFANGGTVKILPCREVDLCNLSIKALNHIKWWVSQGHSLSDIAVLSRNNFHLALLSNMLLRAGIYCNMTEDMKLTKSYMYNDIKDVLTITEKTWKSELTARVLWRLCRYMSIATARAIANFQDNCALSLDDTLGWIAKKFIDKDIEFNGKFNIPLQAEEQIKYQMSKVSNDTAMDICLVYEALKADSREDRIRTLLYQYLNVTVYLYKSEDKNRSIQGLVKYIFNLMKKDGVEKMLNFLKLTEQLESGSMIIPGDKVTLTTIHSAKGREWRDVIMFACDNVSQPSFSGLRGMIEDDIPMGDIFANIDEERRLFYVGNTRAKENLLVITYNKPSVFILEALGAFESKSNNATILELVNDDNWIEHYKDCIEDKINNPSSKYYYDYEQYKVS